MEHFDISAVSNAEKYLFMLVGEGEIHHLVPEFVGDAHDEVDDDLVEEP